MGKVIANGVITGGTAFLAGNFMYSPQSVQIGLITGIIVGLIAGAREYLQETAPNLPQLPALNKILIF